MENLIQLVRQHRLARTEDEKCRIVDEILKLIVPSLEAYLLRACRRPSLVEDLLQDTLVKIHLKLHTFRGNTDGEVMSWCYSIAWRTLCSHFRSNDIGERLEPFDAENLRHVIEASTKEEPLNAEDWEHLEAALALLEKVKPPCRGFLWSHYVREMNYKAIAKAYGLTYNAARMQLQRCLKLAIELTAKHL